MDGQAKVNSKRVAERSSRLLQAELVQTGEWLICVASAEGFAAADYQPADKTLLNSSSPAEYKSNIFFPYVFLLSPLIR